jgi:hypothetical protein
VMLAKPRQRPESLKMGMSNLLHITNTGGQSSVQSRHNSDKRTRWCRKHRTSRVQPPRLCQMECPSQTRSSSGSHHQQLVLAPKPST